jgi:hypothetical protein
MTIGKQQYIQSCPQQKVSLFPCGETLISDVDENGCTVKIFSMIFVLVSEKLLLSMFLFMN